MVSSVLMSEYSLPKVGEFYCEEGGVRKWHPAFTSVQVRAGADGSRVVVIRSPNVPELLITLGRQEAMHLAGLLSEAGEGVRDAA